MKSLTEAQLKALLKKAWEHGYKTGFSDGSICKGLAEQMLQEPIVQTICDGKLIELVGEA